MADIPIGTPSPSGTGNVWSGTGWTNPDNVPGGYIAPAPQYASPPEQQSYQPSTPAQVQPVQVSPTVNPYNPLTQPGSYTNYKALHPQSEAIPQAQAEAEYRRDVPQAAPAPVSQPSPIESIPFIGGLIQAVMGGGNTPPPVTQPTNPMGDMGLQRPFLSSSAPPQPVASPQQIQMPAARMEMGNTGVFMAPLPVGTFGIQGNMGTPAVPGSFSMTQEVTKSDPSIQNAALNFGGNMGNIVTGLFAISPVGLAMGGLGIPQPSFKTDYGFGETKITTKYQVDTGITNRADMPKTGGVDYSHTFIGADNKPTNILKQEVGTPFEIDGQMYQNYETTDLNKVSGIYNVSRTETVKEKSIYSDWNNQMVQYIPQNDIDAKPAVYKTGNLPADTVLNHASAFAFGFQDEARRNPLDIVKNVSFAVATMGVGSGVGAYATTASAGTRLAPVVAAVGKYSSPAMLAMYGTSVAIRTTDGFTDFSPAASERLGRLSSTEIIPFYMGGKIYNRATTPSSGISFRDSLSMAYERTPSRATIREGILDYTFSWRQRASGIERMPEAADRSYYKEEPYSSSYKQPPAYKNSPPIYDSPQPIYKNSPFERGAAEVPYNTQFREAGTDVATVPYERTVMGTAYDITRGSASYKEGSPIKIQSFTDVITTNEYGGITSAQKTSLPTIDAAEYARSTGVDLIGGKDANIGFMDVFRTQTTRDVYKSGVSYTNVIGRKATTDMEATQASGLISPKPSGMEYGQFSTMSKLMSEADAVLNTGRPIPTNPKPVSPTDLPYAVTDLSVGYGSVKIGSSMPVASGADTMSAFTRGVRGTVDVVDIQSRVKEADTGDILKRLSILDNKPSTTVSTPQRNMPSSSTTLPRMGTLGKEVYTRTGGVSQRSAAVKELLPEDLSVDINKDFADMLYGREATEFSSASQRLREGTGTERMKRVGRIPTPAGGITPLSKTFPPRNTPTPKKPDTKCSGGGCKGGNALLIEAKVVDTLKSTVDAGGISDIMSRLKTKQGTQEPKKETQQVAQRETRNDPDVVSPYKRDFGQRSPHSEQQFEWVEVFDEGYDVSPSAEAVKNTGIGVVNTNFMGVRTGMFIRNTGIMKTGRDSMLEQQRKNSIFSVNSRRQTIAKVKPQGIGVRQELGIKSVVGTAQRVGQLQRVAQEATQVTKQRTSQKQKQELVARQTNKVAEKTREAAEQKPKPEIKPEPIRPVPKIIIPPIPLPGLPGGGGGLGGSNRSRGSRGFKELIPLQSMLFGNKKPAGTQMYTIIKGSKQIVSGYGIPTTRAATKRRSSPVKAARRRRK